MTVYSILKIKPLLIAEFETVLINHSKENGDLINSDNFNRVIYGKRPFMTNLRVDFIFNTESEAIKKAYSLYISMLFLGIDLVFYWKINWICLKINFETTNEKLNRLIHP